MKDNRFDALDGWRGISILLVLLGHLVPLGPKALALNGAIAATGMVLFFILSGFLIANIVSKDPNVLNFLIRRFFRIIPLAWLTLLVSLFILGATPYQWVSNFFFFANLPPFGLTDATGHFWSLSLEVQFYVAVALSLFLIGQRTLWALPVAALAITSYRAIEGMEMVILTQFRIDEILAGCTLLLLHNSDWNRVKSWIGRLNPWLLLVLLIASAHEQTGALNYVRPYIAMLLVGSTLFNQQNNVSQRILSSRTLLYLATISYALYIFHGILADTWLGSGDKLEKYLKRPLLLAATFALAHWSTKYYESYWVGVGKFWIEARKTKQAASTAIATNQQRA